MNIQIRYGLEKWTLVQICNFHNVQSVFASS